MTKNSQFLIGNDSEIDRGVFGSSVEKVNDGGIQ